MAKKTMSTKMKEEPIFTWATPSSKPRAGGQYITYETRLNSDGLTSCNCPGWAFARNGVHSCKHTRKIEAESREIFKKWKKGEIIEKSYNVDVTKFVDGELKEKMSNESGWAGRVITLD